MMNDDFSMLWASRVLSWNWTIINIKSTQTQALLLLNGSIVNNVQVLHILSWTEWLVRGITPSLKI